MEFVTAISRGDSDAPATPEAFSDWVRPHVPAMARLAARLAPTGDRDDIVQEALARAWQKRDQFDARRGAPGAWLLAITADRARHARRRRSDAWLPADIVGRVRSSDDRLDLEYAIAKLPPRQRLAVDCFYFVGLSIADTAAVMGCSEGTVKSTLSDARNRLKPLLEVRE